MTRDNRKVPLIGVTIDIEGPGGYADDPWYAVRANYCEALVEAGGLPVLLPHHPDGASTILAKLDGLLITGGNFDIPPSLYGDTATHIATRTKDGRTAAEVAYLREALSAGKPVLGICGGMQLIAALHGNRLFQHLPEEIGTAVVHDVRPAGLCSHPVRAESGSILARSGPMVGEVNSAHHQGLTRVKEPLFASARSEDGVIEAIERRDAGFLVGLQWHPEYRTSPWDRSLFAAFIAACREGQAP